jgi:DNA-binding transcriptional ArsR family regulator
MAKYVLTTDQLSLTVRALSDPTCRAILARISDGDATVTKLVVSFEMNLPDRPDAGPLKEAANWLDECREF